MAQDGVVRQGLRDELSPAAAAWVEERSSAWCAIAAWANNPPWRIWPA